MGKYVDLYVLQLAEDAARAAELRLGDLLKSRHVSAGAWRALTRAAADVGQAVTALQEAQAAQAAQASPVRDLCDPAYTPPRPSPGVAP